MKQNFQRILTLLFLLTIIILTAYVTYTARSQQKAHDSIYSDVKSIVSQANQNMTEESDPIDYPFAELTIPYLQHREYQSTLGELEQLSTEDTYTSYLTNYNSDGLTINGLLTIPSGQEPELGWPAVVFIHGYIPPQQYRTTEKYEAYVDYLARNGIVVFKIDLRGHGNSDGLASGAYFSGDYIIDTLNAVAALTIADFVNSEEIGLWGHSMAGNVVLRSIAAQPSIQKAVIWAGAVYTYEDFAKYGISDASYQRPNPDSPRRQEREDLFTTHGEFSPESEFWQQVPATNYLDTYSGKIQIHHARNDSVVPIEYSENLQNILRNTSVSFEIFEYQSGGHNITSPAFSQAMQRTVEFLQ